jgi:hypothetical protein
MTQLIDRLRQKHRRFLYHGYSVALAGEDLKIGFDFEIEPEIRFHPGITIGNIDKGRVSGLQPAVLDNLAFHLGLMEIPSYWKATCAPEIVIEAGPLDDYQISWWKELLLNGLGEFFYRNDIDFTTPDFVDFKIDPDFSHPLKPYQGGLDPSRVLVPIGGGKDSAVTSELLKGAEKETICFSLNPTPAALGIISLSKSQRSVIVKRTIDEGLLRLNAAGYLNGHTPFSAYLAFLTATCAILFDLRDIAVSNERSSNEANLTFNGRKINHQYSKSFGFEDRFRAYSRRYLAKEVNYFSFLRPLYELQIAKIFSGFPRYFPVFRSCNKGGRSNSWCHKCEKCLSVFTMLYPFLEKEVLTEAIFSENLFEKEEFIGTARALLGWEKPKPFECVGTTEETAAAFYLCLKKTKQQGEPLPPVLRSLEERLVLRGGNPEKRTLEVLQAWNHQHAIPRRLEGLVAEALKP